MTQDELKLVLDALKWCHGGEPCGTAEAIAVVEKALAQHDSVQAKPEPEQEPVTWGVDWGKAGDIPCVSIIKRVPNGGIEVMAVEYAPYSYTTPPKQEPVAWATREDFYRELDRSINRMRQQMEIKGVVMRCADYDIALPVIDIREGHVLVGQVTSPAQRTWVGLTKEQLATTDWSADFRAGALWAEAKLKDKNCAG